MLETQNGHDGTWIAHSGLSDIANNVFSNAFEAGNTNQMHVLREEDEITAEDLITPCDGDFTEGCFRQILEFPCVILACKRHRLCANLRINGRCRNS